MFRLKRNLFFAQGDALRDTEWPIFLPEHARIPEIIEQRKLNMTKGRPVPSLIRATMEGSVPLRDDLVEPVMAALSLAFNDSFHYMGRVAVLRNEWTRYRFAMGIYHAFDNVGITHISPTIEVSPKNRAVFVSNVLFEGMYDAIHTAIRNHNNRGAAELEWRVKQRDSRREVTRTGKK